METTEVLEEIKEIPENRTRIDRVNRFIAEDPKFKVPFQGDLLRAIPQCLLFLLQYPEEINTFTEARYYSQREIQIVDRDTFNYFASEVRAIRERWGE
jgi:hypothetical protein